MKIITKIQPEIVPEKRRKRVAAYARVSKETDRLLHSVSAQISYYSELIQCNPEWEYVGVYADSGITGTQTACRSEFLRLMQDCEKGLIDIILVKSISRFARNTVDLLNTVRHLKELGIEVRFEKENINSLSSDGELMLSILASFAQEESRSISENVKWGIRKRFQNGTIGTANKHILGYRFDEEQQKYVIIPEEAKTVRRMFQMFLEGLSFKQIAENLNNADIRTILGNPFCEQSVRTLLYHEIYAGDLIRQKFITNDPLTKRKVKNNGELPQYLYSDCHEAIIDRETYEKVKLEIKRRNSLAHPVYFFTGIIRCGCCGSYYSRRKQRDKNNKIYIRWSCRRKLDKKDCKSVNINESTLISACVETIGEDYEDRIISMLIKENRDIEFSLVGGEHKTWYSPPKPIKLPKPRRESNKPKHIFDGMIFCGICGRRYGRVISERKGNPLYWRCRSKCAGNQTCDSVNYLDTEIKEIFCKLFNLPTFDEEQFKIKIAKIIVQKTGSLDFYTTDNQILHDETLKIRKNICDSTCTVAFQNKILCAHCGNDYTKYTSQGKFTYWVCRGKHLTHVKCSAESISDYTLRKVSAYMLDLEEFEEEIFKEKVDYILAFTDGSLEYHFYDGSEKKWQKT